MSTSLPCSVRRGVSADVGAIAEMLDLFTFDHPAARHPRPVPVLDAALFGPTAQCHVLVAEQPGRIVGFVVWRPLFDLFWAMEGADADWLFVRPEARGGGVALALLSAICADVRAHGGRYLHATYGAKLAGLYERVAAGNDARECHLSQSAFDALADLAGLPATEIAASLPDPALNLVPSHPRPGRLS